MFKRIYLTSLVLLSCHAAMVTAAPPPGSAVLILQPKFFPGWQAHNVSYPFVFNDTAAGHYKMYYAGSGSTKINASLWDQWVTGFVTSTDTLNWKYPDNYEQVLFARKFMEGEVIDPAESAAQFDSIFATGACIIQDGSSYKCWYTGWNGQTEHLGGGITRKINFRVGYATSPDGINWNKQIGTAGANSVLGLGTTGEPDAKGAAHPHVLKEGGTYRMWYEGFDGSLWRICYATSSDGINWNKQGIALAPGNSGSLDDSGLRNPVVITRNNKYELWYEGKSGSSPNYHVMRALSPDGNTWTKTGEITLHTPPLSPPGFWSRLLLNGRERIFVDSIIVLPDNSCQVFFARQYTAEKDHTYGTIKVPQSYIYTEVVNP